MCGFTSKFPLNGKLWAYRPPGLVSNYSPCVEEFFRFSVDSPSSRQYVPPHIHIPGYLITLCSQSPTHFAFLSIFSILTKNPRPANERQVGIVAVSLIGDDAVPADALQMPAQRDQIVPLLGAVGIVVAAQIRIGIVQPVLGRAFIGRVPGHTLIDPAQRL